MAWKQAQDNKLLAGTARSPLIHTSDKKLYECVSLENVFQDLNWDPEVHQAVLIPTFICKKHNGAILLRNNAARCACGEEIGHTQRNKRPICSSTKSAYTPFSSKWTRILAGMPIFKYLFRNPEGHDIQHLTPGPQVPSSCSLPTET